MNFKKSLYLLLVISLSFQINAQTTTVPEKLQWWSDAKFGMFIHWGLFSQTAGYWNGHKAKGSEHFMLYERIPLNEYAKIANDFNPVKFDAEKWVLTAKNAGLKYIVITSKHHEGFAMFDSPSSNYNIKARTPYAKDPMKELADACRKHGIRFGFYYSLGRDWEDPDVPTNWPVKGGRSNLVDFPNEDAKVFNKYFERKVKPQIKELLTQYGAIDIIWFDTPELISPAESKELLTLINTLQPKCIVNSRIGNNLGDYKVLEQEIVKGKQTDLWESCITMSKNWGYIKYDSVYKSPELLVRQLLEIVSKGGNFLLNVGPTALGEITQPACDRFAIIGKWMSKNSDGIYGTHLWDTECEILGKPTNVIENGNTNVNNTMKDAENDATSKTIIPEVRFLSKDKNLYAFVCSFHEKQVLIKTLSTKSNLSIKKITLIGSNQAIKWKQTPEGLLIDMPSFAVSEIPIVGFKIEATPSGQSALNDSFKDEKKSTHVSQNDFPELIIEKSPAEGIGAEKGVMRRDPSDIIQVGNRYYVWYSKGQYRHGYDASIWYASSTDGKKWVEKGEALSRGAVGSWEEQSVFTPNILEAEGKYWLFYTAVSKPFVASGPNLTRTAIGFAVSDSPDGPWTRYSNNPVLRPSGDEKTFDGVRVDDACLIMRKGKYYLYYKGRQGVNTTANETKMGLAIADKPQGPYIKIKENPVINGGHEVMVWPQASGVAALLTNHGPEELKNKIFYADDGIHFRPTHKVVNTPGGAGAYRPEAYTDSGKGKPIEWGIYIVDSWQNKSELPYLERFDCIWPENKEVNQLPTCIPVKIKH